MNRFSKSLALLAATALVTVAAADASYAAPQQYGTVMDNILSGGKIRVKPLPNVNADDYKPTLAPKTSRPAPRRPAPAARRSPQMQNKAPRPNPGRATR